MQHEGTMKTIPSLIAILLVLAALSPAVMAAPSSGGSGDSPSEVPLNPELLQYMEKQRQIGLGLEKKEEVLGYIPEPWDSSHLKGKKVPKKALEIEMTGEPAPVIEDTYGIVSYPATYDLRALGRMTPVKDQGSCGSCWAFASYASLESEDMPYELLDLSENHLKNTHGFDPAPCAGGNAQMAAAYLARWSGAVNETDDPYVSSSTSSPLVLPVAKHAQEILYIPGRSGPLDNDNIKAAVQTTGALYTTMYYSSTYYNSATKAYYYNGTSGSNHAVAIVGWNDTYSRNNFLTPPPGDGAFIVKNSWGTSWGDKGYFYISYYDVRVGGSLVAFTGESPANYDRVYQYDPYGWISSMGFGSERGWAANVFTAESDEAITAVGLFTNQVNTAYRVEVHLNPNNGPVNTGGPVAYKEGTVAISGYHTIVLPAPVNVKARDRFSIVVRLTTPGYNYPITLEKPLSGYTSKATANAGESYYSSDGVTWSDLVTKNPNANACIKAFTLLASPTTPQAKFSASPTSGAAPLTVTFRDESTGTPTSWLWNFGDGNTSAEKNPVYTYTKPGNYTVSLKASNAIGSSTATKTDYIRVTVPAPVANFTASPLNGTSPLAVKFTDLSTGTPTSWLWNFGDGNTSPLQHPSHTYTNAGTYTVTLTAANSGGSSTVTKTNLITVKVPPPVANFSAAPVSGTAPLSVTFTDLSTNSPTSWYWNFGDGSNSTAKNPEHTYVTPGIYSVTLTAANSGGSNSTTKSNLITVKVPPPVANFTATPTTGVTPLSVTFNDTSTNTPTSWAWNFGDGGTSTERNPVHTYSGTGNYTVTLTASNAGGSDSVTKTNLIVVKAAVLKPVANFTASPTGGTAPLTVTFNDTSLNSPTSWLWNFGDGNTSTAKNPVYTYAKAGNYTVTLTASNAGGSDSVTKTNLIVVKEPVKPVANFSAAPTSGNAPLTVAFTDLSTGNPASWRWEFGDGSISSERNPSHTYNSAGTYTVTLTVANDAGSNTTTRNNLISVAPLVLKPVAEFTATPTSGEAPLTVTFTDLSSNNPTSWQWNFGDGGTTSEKNPAYTYAKAGTYTVTLTAANSGGSSTVTKTDYITITVKPPAAGFIATPTSGEAPLTVAFTDLSTGAPDAWYWDFGDGTCSTERNPAHTYSNAGTYSVTLVASNAGGSSTLTKTNLITVQAPVMPVTAEFTSETRSGFTPLTVAFTDLSSGNPTSYHWDFGDGTTSFEKNPVHIYTKEGSYTVKLTVKNEKYASEKVKKNYVRVTAPRVKETGKGSPNAKGYIMIT